MLDQSLINHCALVVDRSGSMDHLRRKTVEVTDGHVKFLATKSLDMDQETRATVYVFDDNVDCVFFDKDVLRLPSIAQHYRIGGSTALIDATMTAIEDLQKTATMYGSHAFLVFVLTDGMENASRLFNQSRLTSTLQSLPDNWTVAALVPDYSAQVYCEGLGFAKGNIAQWSQSVEGLGAASNKIQAAMTNFMHARTAGVHGSKNIFELDLSKVKIEELMPLPTERYEILDVPQDAQIREFVYGQGKSYVIGNAYYQMTKTETVQPQKDVLVEDIATGKFYGGPDARKMLGLPNWKVSVQPKQHNKYRIFVQSTSVNRKLKSGTKMVLLA